MARSFKIRVRAPGVRGQWRDPKYALRVVLGVLVAMNLIAAALVLFPIGGSAEDLERQLTNLRAQLQAKQALLERTRQHASAVEKGRTEGDRFLTDYFLSTRTAEDLERQLTNLRAQRQAKQALLERTRQHASADS